MADQQAGGAPALEAPASTMATVAGLAAQRFGDRHALVAPDGWPLTYRDLDVVSDEVAARLASAGVGPGSVVNVLLPSGPEYLLVYLALAKLGAITSGINPRLTVPERSALVDLAEPSHVVGSPELLDGVSLQGTVMDVEIASDPGTLLKGLRSDTGSLRPFDGGDDHPVAIVFTSGTTGRGKGAVFTNAQLAAIACIDSGGRWDGGGPVLGSNTQFPHVGMMAKLQWYLRTGTTMLLLHRWRAADQLRLIAEHRLTVVGGVASQIALMLRDPTFDQYDFSHVQFISVGAAPSSPSLINEARSRFGAGYSNRYSCTESGGIATKSDPFGPDEEVLHTAGKGYGGIVVEVHDEEGRRLDTGEEGEIWIKSPGVMQGYWHDAGATAEKLTHDRWVRTGDRAFYDEAGNLHVVGRLSDVYIRGGYNVSPVTVESALSAHPSVAAVAVAAVPDDVMGEVGIAAIVPRPGAPVPSIEELRTFAEGRLARYELPEGVITVSELPLSPMMKLDRRTLRSMVQQHENEIDRLHRPQPK
jgi:acyl-CoA synthetase (AMP-forming)/AMP-acid ligase II